MGRLPEGVGLGLHQQLLLVHRRRQGEAAFLAAGIDEGLAADLHRRPAVGGGKLGVGQAERELDDLVPGLERLYFRALRCSSHQAMRSAMRFSRPRSVGS